MIDGTEPRIGARNVVVDYSRAKVMIEASKHAVPATRVRDILNASSAIVSALIELNQLTKIKDHVADISKVGNSIDEWSIQQVMNFLKCNFEKV